MGHFNIFWAEGHVYTVLNHPEAYRRFALDHNRENWTAILSPMAADAVYNED